MFVRVRYIVLAAAVSLPVAAEMRDCVHTPDGGISCVAAGNHRVTAKQDASGNWVWRDAFGNTVNTYSSWDVQQVLQQEAVDAGEAQRADDERRHQETLRAMQKTRRTNCYSYGSEDQYTNCTSR